MILHFAININESHRHSEPRDLVRMQPCKVCIRTHRPSVRCSFSVTFETNTQDTLHRKGRHPLGQLVTRCNISEPWQSRDIQNMKCWPFNYRIPISPVSVFARTQFQIASSGKTGLVVFNRSCNMTEGWVYKGNILTRRAKKNPLC